MCVCVCVYEGEQETEMGDGEKGERVLTSMYLLQAGIVLIFFFFFSCQAGTRLNKSVLGLAQTKISVL